MDLKDTLKQAHEALVEFANSDAMVLNAYQVMVINRAAVQMARDHEKIRVHLIDHIIERTDHEMVALSILYHRETLATILDIMADKILLKPIFVVDRQESLFSEILKKL